MILYDIINYKVVVKCSCNNDYWLLLLSLSQEIGISGVSTT